MAITNQERVGKAMDLLRAGLAPFVECEMTSIHRAQAAEAARRYLGDDRTIGRKPIADWDVAGLLKLMWEAWNDVFGKTLGRAERSLVQELRDWRNKWAHQEPFTSDDADRALDSMARLLSAVSSPQADDIGKMKMDLRRLIFDEQVRGEKRKAGGSLIEAAGTGTLKPWREVVTPHADVASGRYQWEAPSSPLQEGCWRTNSVAIRTWRIEGAAPVAQCSEPWSEPALVSSWEL